MLQTTVGQLVINDALPEEFRGNQLLDKKGTTDLLRRVAQQRPDLYREISHKLANIGRYMASESGGFSPSLEHFGRSVAARQIRQQLQGQIRTILNDNRLTDTQRHERIIRVTGAAMVPQTDAVFAESLKEGNALAMQIASGSRGNKMNLSSLRGSDLLYSDSRDQVLPLPILHSYSEGLTPAEYWASTYGARKGVVAVKLAVANAGWFSKRLNQIAHRLVVSDLDDPRTDQPLRGMPVDTGDTDNEGALLAQDAGPYKRNTVLTPKILQDLQHRRHDRILVRSPIVGGAPDGSVYARDVGVRETGQLSTRGTMVGMAAAQATGEPISQNTLGAKHTGGVAGQDKAVSGYKALNASIEAPKTFAGGATHAELDGVVQKILPAPAGGTHITVDDVEHYVPADMDLKVKRGDRVEAGDLLSHGLPNYNKVVEHKGIGEGRRYFAHAFRQVMRDSGLQVNRRNSELLARGLINHVKLTDEIDDHIPDDVIPYAALEHSYKPRDDARVMPTRNALGKYLEQPVLHYTIGTKLRPSVLKELDHFGVKEVTTHHEPPPFVPEMVRASASLGVDPDWMTRMYGSGLKTGLLDAVHRGGVSDEAGSSFVPSLARAVDFGHQGLIRTPEQPSLLAPPRSSFAPPAPSKPKSVGLATRFTSLFKFSAHAEDQRMDKHADVTAPTSVPQHTPPVQPIRPVQPLSGGTTASRPSPYTAAQQHAQPVPQNNAWMPGFQGGQPLFGNNPHPQVLQNFVQGAPSGIGQAVNLMTAMDPYATGALTNGEAYTRGDYSQGGQSGQPIDRAAELAAWQQRNPGAVASSGTAAEIQQRAEAQAQPQPQQPQQPQTQQPSGMLNWMATNPLATVAGAAVPAGLIRTVAQARQLPLAAAGSNMLGRAGANVMRAAGPLMQGIDALGVANAYAQGGSEGGLRHAEQTQAEMRGAVNTIGDSNSNWGQQALGTFGTAMQYLNPVSNINSAIHGHNAIRESQPATNYPLLRSASGQEVGLWNGVGPNPMTANAAGQTVPIGGEDAHVPFVPYHAFGQYIGSRAQEMAMPELAATRSQRISDVNQGGPTPFMERGVMNLLSADRQRAIGQLAAAQARGIQLDRQRFEHLLPLWQRYQQGSQQVQSPAATGWTDPTTGRRLMPQEYEFVRQMWNRNRDWRPSTPGTASGS